VSKSIPYQQFLSKSAAYFFGSFLQADEFVELPLELPERWTSNADGMDTI
jgi:hypothetical protein